MVATKYCSRFLVGKLRTQIDDILFSVFSFSIFGTEKRSPSFHCEKTWKPVIKILRIYVSSVVSQLQVLNNAITTHTLNLLYMFMSVLPFKLKETTHLTSIRHENYCDVSRST